MNHKIVCNYCGSKLETEIISDKIRVIECKICRIDCADCSWLECDSCPNLANKIENLEHELDIKENLIDKLTSHLSPLQKIQIEYDITF